MWKPESIVSLACITKSLLHMPSRGSTESIDVTPDMVRGRIEARLSEVAIKLGARQSRAAWTDFFYQLANRIAHLDFLRTRGASAYLVLVNFLNDPDMRGPSSPETWKAAYEVAFHVMGLQKRNPLAPYILEVYPDVGGRA